MFKKLPTDNFNNAYANDIQQKNTFSNSKSMRNLNTSRKYQVKKITDFPSHNNKQYNPCYNRNSSKTIPRDTTGRNKYKSYDYLPFKQKPSYMGSISKNSNNQHCKHFDPEPVKLATREIKNRRKSHQHRSHSLNHNESNNKLNYISRNHFISSDSSELSNVKPKASRFHKTNPNNRDYKRSPCYSNKSPNFTSKNQSSMNSFHNNTKPKNVSFKDNVMVDYNDSWDKYARVHSCSYSKPKYNNAHYTTIYANTNSDNEDKSRLSIRSTYRKNVNIPHSGTRLEGHRKNFDKFCRGSKNSNKNCSSFPTGSRVRMISRTNQVCTCNTKARGGFRKYGSCCESDDSDYWQNCNNESLRRLNISSKKDEYDGQFSSPVPEKSNKTKNLLSNCSPHHQRYHRSLRNQNLHSKLDQSFHPKSNHRYQQSSSGSCNDFKDQVTYCSSKTRKKPTRKSKKCLSTNKRVYNGNNKTVNYRK